MIYVHNKVHHTRFVSYGTCGIRDKAFVFFWLVVRNRFNANLFARKETKIVGFSTPAKNNRVDNGLCTRIATYSYIMCAYTFARKTYGQTNTRYVGYGTARGRRDFVMTKIYDRVPARAKFVRRTGFRFLD